MKKIKMFLEFVSGGVRSAYLDGRTYGDIARMVGASEEEVEAFEKWLGEEIDPGKSWMGSFGSDDEAQVPMFDKIEGEEQYLVAWKRYAEGGKAQSSHSHYEDGL